MFSLAPFLKLTKKRFPFVGLVLAAIAGIIFEEYVGLSSSWLLGLAVVLGVVVMAKTKLLSRWHQQLFFIFVAVSFATLHAWQWQESSALQLSKFLDGRNDDLLVEGIVSSEVKLSKSSSASFFLEVEKIELEKTTITPPVKMMIRWEGPLPSYGDIVRFRAMARSPLPPRNPGEFDASTWLARKEITTELKMDPSNRGEILSSGHGSSLIAWALASRHWAERILTLGIESSPDVVTTIKGITLGLSEHEGFIDDFKLTGTMHLFAVSGLHVGMVAVLVWFFLKLIRLPRRPAVLVTIPILFFYVAMTGFRTGSLRAAIMSSIVLSGFLFYRRPQMINSLAAAAFCLLALETNLLFSAGWQFSFCVVLAILLLATPLQELLRCYYEVDPLIPKKLITPFQHQMHGGMRHLAQLVAVSLAAWIGALIPTIFYFHFISFSSLGANVLAVPLAFIILSIAAMTLFSGLFSSWMAAVFNNANWLVTKLLLLLIHGWTLLPVSFLPVGLPSSSYPVLTIFDFPAAQGAVLQEGASSWVINTGRVINTTRTILPFLEEHGVSHLQGLLLTEQDGAHLGGAEIVAAQLMPASIMMPAGEGRSPLFRRFIEKLVTSHQPSKTLHEGEQCHFSSSCWAEVLYPPAESSEDGLVLKIHLGQTTFLLLSNNSPSVEEWLLLHCSSEMLHATILVFPWRDLRLLPEDRLLKAVAPRFVIVASNPTGAHELPEGPWLELLKQQGITLVSQDQSGAVIIEALPNETQVHRFLEKK